VKCVHIIKCAHFSPKIKCVLHVRNNYEYKMMSYRRETALQGVL